MEVYDIYQDKIFIIGRGSERACKITGKWLTWVPGDNNTGFCFLDLNILSK
ncbi:hypothetical protein N752_09385 [Desulforamulus aquiferis]|nr:hypothetical protein N752_09385 [Desulforamulus aquiferis]